MLALVARDSRLGVLEVMWKDGVKITGDAGSHSADVPPRSRENTGMRQGL